MKKIMFILVSLVLAGCTTVTGTGALAAVSEAQTDAAIVTAKTETLAESAVKDADKLVEVAKSTGDATIIYVAEKHAAEVKKIEENAKAQASISVVERQETKEAAASVAAQEQKAAEVKTELAVTRVKSNTRLFIIIAAIVALVVFLVIKFWAVIKTVFPLRFLINR